LGRLAPRQARRQSSAMTGTRRIVNLLGGRETDTGDTLQVALDASAVPGALGLAEAEGAVRCVACGHRCLIRPGRRGICKVRFNRSGELRVPSGYVAALQCDPTEK